MPLVAVFFFLSGLTGLVYETVWFKQFGFLWGSSSWAAASVVAAFLCGLGLGAYWVGGSSRTAGKGANSPLQRFKKPLATYGWLELGIAAWAVLLHFGLPHLRGPSSWMHEQLSDWPLLHTVARGLFALLCLGLPTFFMGATLPLLTTLLVGRGQSTEQALAKLYAWNSLGAACGAFVAGFWLLPWLGPGLSPFVAVLINAVIGVASLALSSKWDAATPTIEPNTEAPRTQPLTGSGKPESSTAQRLLLLLAMALGFGSLSLQMLWFRQLAVLLGGTTYAFSAVLGVFILGLGAGSELFRRLQLSSQDSVRSATQLAVAACSLLLFSVSLGWALQPSLTQVIGGLREVRHGHISNALLCSLISASLELLPTLAMGILFPALVSLLHSATARAASASAGSTPLQSHESGRAVSRVLVANTFGSILGATLTGPWILPQLGSRWSTGLALLPFAIGPLLLSWALRSKQNINANGAAAAQRGTQLGLGRWALFVLALASATFCLRKPQNPLQTNLGAYLYGNETANRVAEHSELLSFSEGGICNVLVARALGITSLRINGKVDASDSSDMVTQMGLSLFPHVLRPAAEDVLVIGFGSGVSAGTSLQFQQTRVRCIELEPEVAKASKYFRRVNYEPETSPRFELIIDDGRNHLSATRDNYDLILSAPTNPWLVGVSNLFTLEFYRSAQERLKTGGMLAQWLQSYSLSAEEYALVTRTVAAVFPNVALLRLSEQDTLLLASEAQVWPDATTIRQAQAQLDSLPRLSGDVANLFGTTDLRSLLLEHLLLDEAGVQSLIGASPELQELHRDARLSLEFSSAKALFGGRSKQAKRPEQLILDHMDPEGFERAFLRWACGPNQTHALMRLHQLFVARDKPVLAQAVRNLGQRQESAPSRWRSLDLLHQERSLDQQETALQELVQTDLPAALDVAAAWIQQYERQPSSQAKQQFDLAQAALEELTQQHPNSATLRFHWGQALLANGETPEGLQALTETLRIDPAHEKARQLLQSWRASAR